MYNVAVIGDRESVLGFKAVGLDAFEAENTGEVLNALDTAANGGYAVIFIVEKLFMELGKELDRFKDRATPAVIPIPSKDGPQGFGMDNIKKSVERAVGADILFKD